MNLRATDFRIGNLLYCEEISQFAIPIASIETAINYSNYKDEYIIHFNWEGEDEQTGATIDKCEPVPITDEWLEKLGYCRWDERVDNFYDGNFHTRIELRKGVFNFYSYDESNGQQWFLTTIEYVHHLQNLIHALTGTELTIN